MRRRGRRVPGTRQSKPARNRSGCEDNHQRSCRAWSGAFAERACRECVRRTCVFYRFNVMSIFRLVEPTLRSPLAVTHPNSLTAAIKMFESVVVGLW